MPRSFRPAPPAPYDRVPAALTRAGAWAWRLLVVAAAAYGLVRVLGVLRPVVLPVMAALLLAGLVHPVTDLLARHMPRWSAALVGVLLALAMLAGLVALVVTRVADHLPSLAEQLSGSFDRLKASLVGSGVSRRLVEKVEHAGLAWLTRERGHLAGYATTGAGYVLEGITLVALTLFITYFLLYDGARIWGWTLSLTPRRTQERMRRAGHAAWQTATGYVRGTTLIAVIHGVVIGSVVAVLGVPLAVPLGVLVFLGSFVPIAGALVMGAVTVLVALGTHGWVAALVLLAVLIVESQLETNLLQPLIMSRSVRLHPLAIVLALAVGVALAGIEGAVVAVPIAAIAHDAGPALLGLRPGAPSDTVGRGCCSPSLATGRQRDGRPQ